MAKIPTTDRQYYNTTRKINSLAAYSGAMLPFAKQYQADIAEQQSVKIDSLSTDARIQMNELTNQWRLDNQSNPNNPTALKDLEAQYNDILSGYRDQIDPMYRKDWDLQANKLKGAYALNNQSWSIEQNQKNVQYDIQNAVRNNLAMARSYGSSGSLPEAMIELEVSYNKLLDYGAKNLGTETAAQMLNEYEYAYTTQFLSGLAKTNPRKALELLNNDKVRANLGGDADKTARSIIKNEIARRDFALKTEQYNKGIQLTSQIDDMNPIDAIQVLEDSRGSVSDKWYKSRKKSLLGQMGITAETQAETASEILVDIASLPNNNPKDFINGSNDVLERIESEYAAGRLSLSDKKTFTRQLQKRKYKALPDYIDQESGWYIPYDFSDAKSDFDDSFSNKGIANQAMLEYARTLSDNDYNTKQRKELVRKIITDYKNKELNKAINRIKIGDVVSGYRYKGGNTNDPNSWEKI